jgi:hypothetical protein
VDNSTLTGGPPAKEPVPIQPILVSGMAYARIIDGMMNVGFYRDQATPDGGSERVIVAKLMFSGKVSTVIRALMVNQSMLDGAVREEVQREQDGGPTPLERQRAATKRKSSV